MGIEIILSIITAVISGLAAGVAVVAIKSSRKEKELELSHETYKEIREWYQDTLSVMKELYTRYPDNTKLDEKNILLSKLSCQIDFGRSHFPNKEDGTNINKPEAFQGKRPILFDMLTLYYDIFAKGKQSDYLDVLRSLQRSFTSELTLYLKDNKHTNKIQSYEKFDTTYAITPDRLPLLSFAHLEDDYVKQIICDRDLVKVFSDLKAYRNTVSELKDEELEKSRQRHQQEYIDILNKKTQDIANNFKQKPNHNANKQKTTPESEVQPESESEDGLNNNQ